MSTRRAAIILWCALMIVLPFPVWRAGQWGALPPLRSLQHALDGDLPAGLQAVAGALVAGLLAAAYRRWTEPLPVRIRGALVGLFGLSALIIFSAVPVYRWPTDQAQTFIEIYRAGPAL